MILAALSSTSPAIADTMCKGGVYKINTKNEGINFYSDELTNTLKGVVKKNTTIGFGGCAAFTCKIAQGPVDTIGGHVKKEAAEYLESQISGQCSNQNESVLKSPHSESLAKQVETLLCEDICGSNLNVIQRIVANRIVNKCTARADDCKNILVPIIEAAIKNEEIPELTGSVSSREGVDQVAAAMTIVSIVENDPEALDGILAIE